MVESDAKERYLLSAQRSMAWKAQAVHPLLDPALGHSGYAQAAENDNMVIIDAAYDYFVFAGSAPLIRDKAS